LPRLSFANNISPGTSEATDICALLEISSNKAKIILGLLR
jgi:hypothetical protein